jgi:hypothetical protein
MSKDEFLNYPIKEYATGIFSLGEPGSGKTYIMLQSFKAWLQMGIFEECHLILPQFRNEADDSYEGLDQIPNVFIYERYRDRIATDLIAKAKKNNDLFKAKKLKQKPLYFFAVDDATSQGKELMQSEAIIRIATEGRHLNIQSWFCLHATAGIIPPKVRHQLKFMFFYNMNAKVLRTCWTEYINFSEFRKFDDFLRFWDEYVLKRDHGALLVWRNTKYNPFVSEWFS